ncbi:MAG TPA: peptidyl-prolyl cis-trans isomerase [bacterium]|nr:peptidyl-prolyl cis-trans isomerase [bacterium]
MTLDAPDMKLRHLILLLLLLAGCSKPAGPVVVATVDGEPILAEDLQRVLAEQADDYGPDVLADPEGKTVVKKTLLNGLIQEKVLLQTAREKGISLTPEEQEKLSAEAQSGYREGEFEKILEEKKVRREDWAKRRENKKIIDKLIEQEVTAPLKPTEREIEDYYKKYRSVFRLPDRIRCRHIVTNKKDKAEKIRSLLEKGENFASVAQKYSESPDRENGGDLGYVSRGQYPEIFEQACFTLATGQTSDVIQSEYGYHIFRVTDKQPSRQQPLPEVSAEVERRIKEEKAGPALKDWFDQLYRNKKITIDDKALKEVSLGVQ